MRAGPTPGPAGWVRQRKLPSPPSPLPHAPDAPAAAAEELPC